MKDQIVSWWFIGYVAISILFTIIALGESIWREIQLRKYNLGGHKPFYKDWVELVVIFGLLPGINIIVLLFMLVVLTGTWLFPEKEKKVKH